MLAHVCQQKVGIVLDFGAYILGFILEDAQTCSKQIIAILGAHPSLWKQYTQNFPNAANVEANGRSADAQRFKHRSAE